MAELNDIEREGLNEVSHILCAVSCLLKEVDREEGMLEGACYSAHLLMGRAKKLIDESVTADLDSSVAVAVDGVEELLDLASSYGGHESGSSHLSYSAAIVLGETVFAAYEKLSAFTGAKPAPTTAPAQ